MEFAAALPTPLVPSKETNQAKTVEKGKETAKDAAPNRELVKEPAKDSSKGKGTSQSQVLVLATLLFTPKEDPKSKGVPQATTPEATSLPAAMVNFPPKPT